MKVKGLTMLIIGPIMCVLGVVGLIGYCAFDVTAWLGVAGFVFILVGILTFIVGASWD